MGKNKVGRPSKYNTINLDVLTMLAQKGFTDAEMSKVFGISRETLDEYKKRPEFLDTLKKGKEIADNAVEKSLYERACGYEHPEEKIFQHEGQVIRAETVRKYPPDPTSMIFWLKNRRPDQWREKQEVEHSGTLRFDHFIKQMQKYQKDQDDQSTDV